MDQIDSAARQATLKRPVADQQSTMRRGSQQALHPSVSPSKDINSSSSSSTFMRPSNEIDVNLKDQTLLRPRQASDPKRQTLHKQNIEDVASQPTRKSDAARDFYSKPISILEEEDSYISISEVKRSTNAVKPFEYLDMNDFTDEVGCLP